MRSNARYIESYVHDGRIGVLIEFGLGTLFAAKMSEFAQLARDVAVHVAAAQPTSVEDLYQQPFAKDPKVTVRRLLADASRHFGEPVVVKRFVRWDCEETYGDEPPDRPAVSAALRRIA